MDYKLLLLKYIELVGYNGGISFIDEKYKIVDIFTDEEWEELKRLNEYGLRS